MIVSIAIAYWSAPKGNSVKTIDSFDVQFEEEKTNEAKSTRPGDWLEKFAYLNDYCGDFRLNLDVFLNFQKAIPSLPFQVSTPTTSCF